MANCMFLRRRFKSKYPTLTELFASLSYVSMSGANSSTATSFTRNRPNNVNDGETFFFFYCVGDCMQISRIETVNSTQMTFKEIAIDYPTGSTAYRVKLSTQATQLQSTANIYGSVGVYCQFNIDADTAEYMLSHAAYSTVKSYYSSTATDATNADTALRVAQSAFDTHTGGICLVAYRSNQDSNLSFAAVDGVTPTTFIKGAYGTGTTNWWTKSPIYGYTNLGTAYYAPIRTNQTATSAPYTRTLTWKHIKENW